MRRSRASLDHARVVTYVFVVAFLTLVWLIIYEVAQQVIQP